MNDFVQMLVERLGIEEPIQPSTPLLSSGIIDSFDVTALLTIIETEYGVAISPTDIDVETFDTAYQMKATIDAASG